MKAITFSFFFLLTTFIVGQTQTTLLDLKTGNLRNDIFTRIDASTFRDNSTKFSLGGNYRAVNTTDGARVTNVMSFGLLGQYKNVFFQSSVGPCLQIRNGNFGFGALFSINLKKRIANNTFLLIEDKVEVGTRAFYVRAATGLKVDKFSFLAGFESTHAGFFTEIYWELIDNISIGGSYIQVANGNPEVDVVYFRGFAFNLRMKF